MNHTQPAAGASVKDRYAHALMNTFGPPKLVLTRGEGAYVWDAEGRRYLDLLGGIAVNALGHAHPALVSAVSAQLSTLGHVSNFFATEPQVELAERLLALLGVSGKVFFTNSGAEANEAAFKLTRRTGRTKIVAAAGSFHGRTMGALALTSKAAYREPFEPLPGHVTFVEYGDEAALAAAVTDETAAVVLEPIQGEAGVHVAPDGYLATARQVTREHGALLWLDEVQTGIGRTGRWFGHEWEGVTPDAMTLAKALGGGLPVRRRRAPESLPVPELFKVCSALPFGRDAFDFFVNMTAPCSRPSLSVRLQREQYVRAVVSTPICRPRSTRQCRATRFCCARGRPTSGTSSSR